VEVRRCGVERHPFSVIEVERPIVRVADGPSLSSVALAALIVSIVAGIVAALSALYARRVAVVEEERRVDETRPRSTPSTMVTWAATKGC